MPLESHRHQPRSLQREEPNRYVSPVPSPTSSPDQSPSISPVISPITLTTPPPALPPSPTALPTEHQHAAQPGTTAQPKFSTDNEERKKYSI
jgi:hypothetical protein